MIDLHYLLVRVRDSGATEVYDSNEDFPTDWTFSNEVIADVEKKIREAYGLC